MADRWFMWLTAAAMGKKGIILAGGSEDLLHPLTHVLSKQLPPVHENPLTRCPLVNSRGIAPPLPGWT